MRWRAACFISLACVLVCVEHSAAQPVTKTASAPGVDSGRIELVAGETFPPTPLRGYGVVSGVIRRSADRAASVLEITCQDEDKARVMHAKFLSDLTGLPGVGRFDLTTPRGKVTARRVAGQGVVAAVRCGAAVVILAAQDEARLLALYHAAGFSDRPVSASVAEATVPMFLDRWDRYGFRFYYSPWMRPRGPDGKDIREYDPLPEFDFLRKTESGVVLWATPLALDTSEGVLNYPWWDWALRHAKTDGLAAGINLEVARSPWAYNRYPDQVMGRMPEYVGGWYGLRNFDNPILAWSAFDAKDRTLAVLQKQVRLAKASYDNIVNWLEPHGEMGHAECDVLTEYGPQADVGYRQYLSEKYHAPEVVAQRWGGESNAIKTWGDVHVPELASFLGWGPEALDLTGTWRVSFDAAYGAASSSPDLDDSAWPTMTAPGHDIAMLLPKKPAVYRRHFDVDPAWKSAHPRVWLYVWDLNDVRPRRGGPPPAQVLVYLNGKLLPEPPFRGGEGHWAALDTGDALRTGNNLLAVSLPQGYFGYRVYLSPHEPRQYPALGPDMNAQWVDFIDFLAWVRIRAVRSGAEMIRQADPDRPITFMHPDEYATGIKQVCEDFGGVFHNTGYMAGAWMDMNVSQMNGVDLPTDVEPGSGAVDLPDFKRFMGRWSTEGVQGVDYFIHVGDVLWKPEIKAYFEQTQNLWHLLGKYHVPTAQVALLVSDRTLRLSGFPWGYAPNVNLRNGYWSWGLASVFQPDVPRDAIDEGDFASGNADRYRVIVDTNTSIMDDELIAQIERWVRAGGIFVTYAQTGRHTPTGLDAWPISRLSGYAVTAIDPHDATGRVMQTHRLAPAAGANIFHGNWKEENDANGLTLKKVAPECQDLLLWQSGGVAVGMRPLGKGFVIHNGVKFAQDHGISNWEATRRLFNDVFNWAGVVQVPSTAEGVLLRHFITNNGLYDVWAMWNEHEKPVTTDLVFRGEYKPASVVDVNSGKDVPLVADGTRITGLHFDAWETHVLLSPRGELAEAPGRWFALQRNWWRGTTSPGEPLPLIEERTAVDLTEGWTFRPIEPAQTDVSALAAPSLDDSAWEHHSLGIISLPDHREVRHVVFRRRFTVPANWTGGRVALWVRTSGNTTYVDKGRVYLDGNLSSDWLSDGLPGMEFGGALQPGTTHVVAIEVKGAGSLVGVRGAAWLAWKPAPLSRQDLAGDWELSPDGLRYGPAIHLPGPGQGLTARRVIRIDADSSQTAVFHALADDAAIMGVIVNGRRLQRAGGRFGPEVNLNLMPFLRKGQDNELILIAPGGKWKVRELSIDFYDRGTYP